MGDVTRSSGTDTYFGGFCGYNNSTIEYCYAIGSVTYDGVVDPTDKGFVGGEFGTPTYADNHFDSEASNQNTGTGATAQTTANMKLQITYSNWDFAATPIWVLCNGYPYLAWQETIATAPTGWSDGSGGTISTLAELRWLSQTIAAWEEDWLLGADIDAEETGNWNCGLGFSPIGNDGTKFTGTFDGQDYTISNLYINRPTQNNVGLFGFTNDATVSNVGIVDCDITGQHSVGGLVGTNFSAGISNSYATGSVTGDADVGGLVGFNRTSSTISNSYSTGDVIRSSGSSTNFGGFCGHNDGSTIEYCYSIGSVDCGGATDKGFVGGNNSGTYNHNFFDSDASGQTSGTGATATGTADMENQTTYTTAPVDWDFIRTWEIDGVANNGYPFHKALPTAPSKDGDIYLPA